MTMKLSLLRLDPKTMKELVEATLDTVQLPDTSPMDSMVVKLVGTLKEIAEDKQTDWMEEQTCQDVQWWTTSTTSLLSIKNQMTVQ